MSVEVGVLQENWLQGLFCTLGREVRRAVLEDQPSGTSAKLETGCEWSSAVILGPRSHQK